MLQHIREVQQWVESHITYHNEPPGEDTWQTPLLTRKNRSGDCEDLAILKFHMLRERGVPNEAMSLVYGFVHGVPHVVLHIDGWVLDVNGMARVEDYNMEAKAYTMGATPFYEDPRWSEVSVAKWRAKVSEALA